MNELYSIVKIIWTKLPESVKKFVRSISYLNSVKQSIKDLTIQNTSFDEIYDEEFFKKHQISYENIKTIANSIVEHFHPKTLLDVGCGEGSLIENMKLRGVYAIGLERAEAALKICQRKSLYVLKFDLEKDELPDLGDMDVFASMEVAEHLPESCAERYIALLCKKANIVVFTAATPGQGGTKHINEQPHQYWIDKFIKHGFKYNEPLSLQLRLNWKNEKIPEWYHKNLMIFKKIHDDIIN